MRQAGIRAHSGTVQRLVGPVDLARFDSTVKVPTEGSGRTSRHPGRRVPVRSLCDGPGVHSAGSARVGLDRKAVIMPFCRWSEPVATQRRSRDADLARLIERGPRGPLDVADGSYCAVSPGGVVLVDARVVDERRHVCAVGVHDADAVIGGFVGLVADEHDV